LNRKFWLFCKEEVKFKTFDNLLDAWKEDERQELINGEIVRRPMPRSEHGLVQAAALTDLGSLSRISGTGGWWIIPEINVHYGEHQCPCHDLAGWRKERLPKRPSGIMEMTPDWVCEIVSPGHERKDMFYNFMLLQSYAVPYYWIISPEDKTIIAYHLVGENYHSVFSIECNKPEDLKKVRIPPFEEVEIDLAYVFAEIEE